MISPTEDATVYEAYGIQGSRLLYSSDGNVAAANAWAACPQGTEV